MNVANRQRLERRIVRAAVAEALRTGHKVSVNDGEVWTVSKSTDLAEIMGAVMTTDEDKLRIYDARGERIGDVWLVYGNDGYDVIADYHDNPEMETVLKPAFKIADRYA